MDFTYTKSAVAIQNSCHNARLPPIRESAEWFKTFVPFDFLSVGLTKVNGSLFLAQTVDAQHDETNTPR